jgi:microcystin-dependent protein
MPKHNHSIYGGTGYSKDNVHGIFGNYGGSDIGVAGGNGGTNLKYQTNNVAGNSILGMKGNNQPHNNMPPYTTVNIWYRKA